MRGGGGGKNKTFESEVEDKKAIARPTQGGRTKSKKRAMRGDLS